MAKLPTRQTEVPCLGDCVVRGPGCLDDCLGFRMTKGPKSTGYQIECEMARRAWRERHPVAKPKTKPRNRNPETGHILPNPDGADADYDVPPVIEFQDRTPLEVLRTYFPHLVEDSRAAWHVFLKAAFGEPLTPEEREVYLACTGRESEFEEAVREIWLICGRRAGKSEIVAFLAVYLALFRKYNPTKGTKLVGMVLAADREQAGVIMGYISEMLHSHPRLRVMIARRGTQFRETKRSIELVNGITIRVNTSNYRRVRGYTVAFVLCDEIAFWETEDAANPDHEVLKALRPALGTTRGMLICLSSPYAQKGELYKNYERHWGVNDSRVFVWKAATRVMNPTFPQEDIDLAYADDHSAADAEYGANFRTDVQAFLEQQALEAVMVPDLERPPEPGVTYRAFVDPAGGSGKDSMTLAIGFTKDDVEHLACVREVPPKFNPDAVTQEFAELLKTYRVSSVTGDRYAGEWPRERFRAHQIEYVLADHTKSELYKSLLPLVNSKRVDLLGVGRLKTQLLALERRTARGGKDSVDHPKNGHDDVANAVAGVLVSGGKAGQYRARCLAA